MTEKSSGSPELYVYRVYGLKGLKGLAPGSLTNGLSSSGSALEAGLKGLEPVVKDLSFAGSALGINGFDAAAGAGAGSGAALVSAVTVCAGLRKNLGWLSSVLWGSFSSESSKPSDISEPALGSPR